jgi:hypothetical protein
MQPTQDQVKELITKLDAQHPNPWTKGATYPAVNPFTGEEVKIRRSRSVGDRRPFLHIYVKCTQVVNQVVKTPTGEILSRRPSQRHYRANLTTYTIEEV